MLIFSILHTYMRARLMQRYKIPPRVPSIFCVSFLTVGMLFFSHSARLFSPPKSSIFALGEFRPDRRRSGRKTHRILHATCTISASNPHTMIPYKRHTLSNGLTVAVNRDRQSKLAAVNILYKVGARNEDPARTGFAHLFEHLMFRGTATYRRFRPAGADGLRRQQRLHQ